MPDMLPTHRENTLPEISEETDKATMVRALKECALWMQECGRKMEALQKEFRINTPLTRQMELNLTRKIRQKARELSARYAEGDAKAPQRIAREIRKALYEKYAVRDLRSIPKIEYEIAMERVDMTRWTKPMGER